MISIPLLTGSRTGAFAGLQIVTDPYLLERCEDFSRCRSPSRARRRWKQRGIKGHGVFERPMRHAMRVGGTLRMHPATAEAMRAYLAHERDTLVQDAITGRQTERLAGLRADRIIVDDPHAPRESVLDGDTLRAAIEALPPDPFRHRPEPFSFTSHLRFKRP